MMHADLPEIIIWLTIVISSFILYRLLIKDIEQNDFVAGDSLSSKEIFKLLLLNQIVNKTYTYGLNKDEKYIARFLTTSIAKTNGRVSFVVKAGLLYMGFALISTLSVYVFSFVFREAVFIDYWSFLSTPSLAFLILSIFCIDFLTSVSENLDGDKSKVRNTIILLFFFSAIIVTIEIRLFILIIKFLFYNK